MFNKHDISRDACMLHGPLKYQGYDWWWHSFTGREETTGEEKAFFIEFFVCNPALGGDEPVLGQLPANREAGVKPSYLMVKARCMGRRSRAAAPFLWMESRKYAREAPYSIEAEDCFASETELRGSIRISDEEAKAHPEWMCDSGKMLWDLHVDKQIAFNVGYGASKPLRDIEAFAMYWHAEGMKSAYDGWVEYNGKRYIVAPETSYGYADKNWGRDFTSPWVWLSSNCLKSRKTGEELRNSVFDIGGGRPKIYFVPLDRRLLGVFWYEGKEYDFNFSKVWLDVNTKFSFHEDEENVYWHVTQENIHALMDTEITCRKKDMLLVNYEAPDGSKKHNRLWNGGNGRGIIRLYERRGRELELVVEIVATHVGCEYGEYDQAGTAVLP